MHWCSLKQMLPQGRSEWQLGNLPALSSMFDPSSPPSSGRNVISSIVHSHQENDPSASFVNRLFLELDRKLGEGRPAIIETTLVTVGKIAR